MRCRRLTTRVTPVRSVRLSTGHEIPIDAGEPDLLGILEALYREVTLKRALDVTYDDMMKELRGLVAQMDPAERDAYLVESLFSASVRYENERFEAYARKLTTPPGRKRARGRPAGSDS